MSWMPRGTWAVAQVDLDGKRIDEALTTLERLPIWPLVGEELPSKDGAGLRTELLEMIAKEGGTDAPSADELEDAFGNHLGVAITDNDFARFEDDNDDVPVIGWIEVDDADKAEKILSDALDEKSTFEHKDVEAHTGTDGGDDEITWLVSGDVAIVTTTREEMQRLIDARDAGTTVGEDEDARRVLSAALDESIMGVAVATDPIMDAVPQILEQEDDAPKRVRDQVRDVLASGAIDSLVPDWIGFGATIDDTGVRMRATWSNPRELAKADIGARELAERMPEATSIVNAATSDGAWVGRMQAAWQVVTDETDVSLDDLADDCTGEVDAWACEIAVETLRMLLEDEDLAKAAAKADPVTAAVAQDFGALLAQGLSAAPGAAKPAAKAAPARSQEYVVAGDLTYDYDIPAKLDAALTKAGISIEAIEDGTGVQVRVTPASPAGRELATALKDPAARVQFATLGIDPADLLRPAGLVLQADEVDDLLVYGFPQDAASPVTEALDGDADTLGDLDRYRDAVETAKAPKEVGTWGWVDIRGLVERTLDVIGPTVPAAAAFDAPARQNVKQLPGILTWTAREDVDGEDVGVAELALPILERP